MNLSSVKKILYNLLFGKPAGMESDYSKSVPRCIRCGICCISGICDFGYQESESDICQYLKFDKAGKATCLRMVEVKVKIALGCGTGCVLRTERSLLKFLRSSCTPKILEKVNDASKNR
jgi:hypothetical protein